MQIMILQSICALAMVVFEVPTGVVADKVGRKQSMQLCGLFFLAASVTYVLSHGFWQFAAAELLWAIGACFASGADSALLYDSLKQSGREREFKRVWGNACSAGYLAAGIASLFAGFIAVYGLRMNWAVTAGSMLAAFLISLFLKEPRHYRKVAEKNYIRHTIACFRQAFTSKTLLFLVLFEALRQTIARLGLWFYQPYMAQSGLGIKYFGIAWAAFTIFSVSGSTLSHKIEAALKEKWSLWAIILSMVLSFVFMSAWFSVFGLAFIFLQQFIRGFATPVIQDYTNKHLSTGKRATLLSIQSLPARLLFAVLAPVFGYLADVFSLSASMMVIAVSFFIGFLALMLWKK